MSDNGPTAGERFVQGILPENPVLRQLLGLCPTLAVTGAMKPAMTMVGATAFVLISANIIISLIRPLLKPHLRILVFTLTIATFVTIADKVLAAYMYEMSKTLGPYIPLIIVNCIIISRCEICASKQSLPTAIADGVGVSLGFMVALGLVASTRELLGAGAWFGVPVMETLSTTVFGMNPAAEGNSNYPQWVLMVMPPGAFITLGLLLGMVNWFGMRKKAKQQA